MKDHKKRLISPQIVKRKLSPMNITNITQTCNKFHTSVAIETDTAEVICLCRAGFDGIFCEKRVSWYGPAALPVHVIHTLLVILSLGACVIRSGPLFCSGRYKGKKALLAKISVVSIAIGNVCMLAYDFMPSVTLFDHHYNSGITLLKGVFLYGAQLFWLVSTSLILGFWYDALKMNTSKFTRSKIFILVLAILQVLGALFGSFIFLAIAPHLGGVPLDILVIIGIIIGAVHINYIRTQNLTTSKRIYNETSSSQTASTVQMNTGVTTLSGGKTTTDMGNSSTTQTRDSEAGDVPRMSKKDIISTNKSSNEEKRVWVVRMGIVSLISLALLQILYYISIGLASSHSVVGVFVVENLKHMTRAVLSGSLVLLVDYRLQTVRSVFRCK